MHHSIANPIGNKVYARALACIFICAITLALSTRFAYASEPWQLYKSNAWLDIYYRKLPNGLLQVKGHATLDKTTTKSVIGALTDTDSIPLWVDNIQSVTLLAAPQENRSLVHTKLNLPWPVADREMLTLSCFSQIEDNQHLLQIRSVFAPEKSDSLIRITEIVIDWEFFERTSGLDITYTAQAQLNGSVPQWLANKASLKNTQKMLQALKAHLATQQAQLSNWTLLPGDCDGF
ncbi:START domain-containing protein [Pseudoalteromonas sp. SMS1]|uniref:START domain-containing protein n=1 Tax=Pseudoalteromonas sp. SMS1 TaxID=2908894 RepID=UPI001F179A40|nr:START domain-containing protein [Pseudoalteromonas sp. SMS1]MCF2857897.1 START domain-containing protein [Pseudoalteromonas sp. SMS1]